MARPATDSHHLLIGGGGFMGSAFRRHLGRSGQTATSIGRGVLQDDSAREALVESLTANGRQVVIVDFAYTSVPNSSFDDPVKDYSDNLYNLLQHLRFGAELENSLYVYVSSGGTVYGNASADEPMTEDHPNVPLSPYGITKLACERYVLMHQHVHGLRTKIVRPANIYGPGQKPFRGQGIVSTVAAKLLRDEPIRVFGDGSTTRDYLYVDDFCAALSDVVAFGSDGEIYNIGSGSGHSITSLVERIQAQLELPAIQVERAAPRPFDVRFNVLDCAKLQGLNRWRPTTSLDTGLALSIEWLKSLPEL